MGSVAQSLPRRLPINRPRLTMSEFLLLAAKTSAEAAAGPSGPSMPMCWAIVGFMTILGLLVTLSPPKRTYESQEAEGRVASSVELRDVGMWNTIIPHSPLRLSTLDSRCRATFALAELRDRVDDGALLRGRQLRIDGQRQAPRGRPARSPASCLLRSRATRSTSAGAAAPGSKSPSRFCGRPDASAARRGGRS